MTHQSPFTNRDLIPRFDAITRFVDTHRHLWEPRPFQLLTLPWERDFPTLTRWLRSLDEPTINLLELHTSALLHTPLPEHVQRQLPTAYRALLEETRTHTVIGSLLSAKSALSSIVPTQRPLPTPDHTSLPHFWSRALHTKVPQRKWQQLQHLLACLFQETHTHALPMSSHAVDWCAGKGHLGRTFAAQTHTSTRTLERNAALCTSARHYAERLQAPVEPIHLDVLTPRSHDHLRDAHTVFGLHACGLLSTELIRRATLHNVPTIVCAPCCHHALPKGATHYTPLSQHARHNDLSLDHGALRLSIADEIVAPPRERRQRQHERIYRLGFDLLHREASGEDTYRSLGTLPHALWKLSFRDFCETVADLQELPLPSVWDPEAAEAHARLIAHETRALGLVRALFRRPLDMWVVLDRAIFLHEAQRPVSLGTFCSPHLSPRNLLIMSSQHDGPLGCSTAYD